MRTRTLLLAAALSAAGIATSMAQSNVYSINVVGYVNQVFASPSLQIMANPLNTTSNTIANLVQGKPNNTIVSKFDSATSQFAAYTWNGSVWNPNADAVSLNPGEGAFISIPGGVAGGSVTQTWVGEVMQGTLSNPLPAGLKLVGSMVPQAGLVKTTLGFPATANGDQVQRFVGNTTFDVSSYNGSVWNPSEPTIAVAEGFFSRKTTATTWVRNFTVQ